MKSRRRWIKLVLIAFFAWMATGGSFTCFYSDHDHHHPPQSSGK